MELSNNLFFKMLCSLELSLGQLNANQSTKDLHFYFSIAIMLSNKLNLI